MPVLLLGPNSLTVRKHDCHMFTRSLGFLSRLPFGRSLCNSIYNLLLSGVLVHGHSTLLLIATLLPYMLVVASISFAQVWIAKVMEVL